MDDSALTLSSVRVKKEDPDESTTFSDGTRMQACFSGLLRLYEDGELCDVTLVAEGQEFPCHRVVLAAATKYFHAMLTGGFAEKNKRVIHMNDMKATCLRMVLDYLYKGEVSFNIKNVQELFVAAHMLELASLTDACARFMKQHINQSNCIGFMTFARAYNHSELLRKAVRKMETNFAAILQGEEFLQLDIDGVIEVLSTRELSCSGLNEETFCDAALTWLRHTWPNRRKYVYQVMRIIRLVYLSENYYRQVKKNPLLKASPRLQHMFQEVDYLTSYPNRWHEVDLILDPRWWPNFEQERVLVCSGRLPQNGKQESKSSSKDVKDLWMVDSLGGVLQDYPGGVEKLRVTCPILVAGGGGQGLFIISGGGRKCGKMVKYTPEEGIVKMASMKQKRSRATVAELDDWFFAVGGEKEKHGSTQTRLVNYAERYSKKSDKWSKVKSLPFLARELVLNRFFCRKTSVYTASDCLQQWEMTGMSAISYRGKLYVFGGETAAEKTTKPTVSACTYSYDPSLNQWQECQSMKYPRTWSGCAVYRDKIYVLGGSSDSVTSSDINQSVGTALKSVEIYNPCTDTWTEGPELSKPVTSPGVIKYLGSVAVIGGVGPSGPCRDLWLLSEEGASWQLVDSQLGLRVTPSLYSACTPLLLKSPKGLKLPHDMTSDSSFSSVNQSMTPGNRSHMPPPKSKKRVGFLGASDSMDSDSSLEEVTRMHQSMMHQSMSHQSINQSMMHQQSMHQSMLHQQSMHQSMMQNSMHHSMMHHSMHQSRIMHQSQLHRSYMPMDSSSDSWSSDESHMSGWPQ